MLSKQTCLELIKIIDQYSKNDVERLFIYNNLNTFLIPNNTSKFEKSNILLSILINNTQDKSKIEFQNKILQYVVDKFYENKDINSTKTKMDPNDPFSSIKIEYDDFFKEQHINLSNSLLRDGYYIKGKEIRKTLPYEIVEAKTENELTQFLENFKFNTSKGHLEQAISNHSQSNWAGANAQFRPFIESLLIEISNLLLPNNPCNNASTAIKLLSKSIIPAFLREDLNEVESRHCDKPFIEGFYKRLHPQGSHPGLSDEIDCTFRYHITIVFSHYLLHRLRQRIKDK